MKNYFRSMLTCACTFLLAVLVLSSAVRAQDAAAPVTQPKKTVYLLAIGNSFSGNASKYLNQIVEADGNKLVFGHAMIGGCPLEKHLNLAQKFEANPEDPAGKPYKMKNAEGKMVAASLKDLLTAEKWQYVTIQQFSFFSFKIETYRPYAQELVNYVHKYAPQAKIYVHETWAYRSDDPLFKDGFTHEKMYQQLHDNYTTIAKEVGAERVIPVGTAFENAIKDPAWAFTLPEGFNAKELKHPELPDQKHSLNVGYRWDTKSDPPKLVYDGHHASTIGCYLGGAVWYEVFFGDVRGNKFVPKEFSPEDVAYLQKVAHDTVAETK